MKLSAVKQAHKKVSRQAHFTPLGRQTLVHSASPSCTAPRRSHTLIHLSGTQLCTAQALPAPPHAHAQELQLSHNTIMCVPFELGALPNLRALDLSHNQIKLIPSSLCRLTSLTALNLMGNQLSALPEDIGNLSQLR